MERYIKKIITTNFQEHQPLSNYLTTLNENFNCKIIIIGAIEKTQEEKEHYHSYIEFTRQIRFSTFKNIFPSVHLEAVQGTIIQNYNYVTKEGLTYSNISYKEIEEQEQKKEEEKDICEAVIEDLLDNNLTLYEILKKYPKFAFYNFKTIQEIKNISVDITNKK